MAISIPSPELPRSFAPLVAHSSASSVPLVAPLVISTKVGLGRRSTGKLSSVFKFCTPPRAMVGGSGQKFTDGIAISGNQQEVAGIIPQVQERDFTNTPYVPVYVKLPKGAINRECKLVDPDYLINQLKILKSIKVDGVKIDCWWGIVEARGPQQYNWGVYKEIFRIVRDLKFKLQVVMCFHECGNLGDDVHIPLPQWVIEIGSKNPDIFFTDKEGRRNQECLSWGVDSEPVLRGRRALQVYFDYMESFHVEFEEFFKNGVISEIEIGLGPCGELRYPSHPVKHGWKYPGIGEFQANIVFGGTPTVAKLPCIHWWYHSKSHAAEFTAGFYHKTGRNGYVPILLMLKKHKTALNLTGVELRTLDQYEEFPEALADPEDLVLEVLYNAWDIGIPIGAENALPCYGRQGFDKILQNVKPYDGPDEILSSFTYLWLSPDLVEGCHLREFERFVKQMHGKILSSYELIRVS
ncbi:UNVERIFIED_CONTAM: Beta-amylase 2, chloroplastic [Sesamum radiatum]|uniref:Beta-amylase n=1 Tax=Sesamum radiatum TaxID=300843 RepID=A0AAW2KGF5_SESRA